MQEVIKEDLTLNGFADNPSICKQFKPRTNQEQDTIAILESSLEDVKTWMDSVRLKIFIADWLSHHNHKEDKDEPIKDMDIRVHAVQCMTDVLDCMSIV